MSSSEYVQAEDKLRVLLSRSSFNHCERTSRVARELAKAHSEDVELCEIAGLVHDVARDQTDEQFLDRARQLGLPVAFVEQQRPYLLHAAVGAAILTEELGLDDARISRAVARHTFGAPQMTKMEKIVYLADMIEPARSFEGVERLRDLAPLDLQRAYLTGFRRQLMELVERGRYLHPQTIDAWNDIALEVRELD